MVVCRVEQKYWDVVAENDVVDETEWIDFEVWRSWCRGFDGFSRY